MTNQRQTTTPGPRPGVTWTKRTVAVLAMLAGLLAAGCGGGGGDDDDVASVSGDDGAEEASADDEDPDAELLDWVECMRDEGVDISDPTRDADGNLQIDGPGIHIGGGPAEGGTSDAPPAEPDGEEPDIDPEAMAAATDTCGPPPMGRPGNISEEDRQEMEASALEFAECMRDEGIENFPDPDFSGSGPGGAPETHEDSVEPGDAPDGGSPRVMVGPFGEIDMSDPATAAAFEACQDLIAPPGAGGTGGGDSGEGSDT